MITSNFLRRRKRIEQQPSSPVRLLGNNNEINMQANSFANLEITSSFRKRLTEREKDLDKQIEHLRRTSYWPVLLSKSTVFNVLMWLNMSSFILTLSVPGQNI